MINEANQIIKDTLKQLSTNAESYLVRAPSSQFRIQFEDAIKKAKKVVENVV